MSTTRRTISNTTDFTSASLRALVKSVLAAGGWERLPWSLKFRHPNKGMRVRRTTLRSQGYTREVVIPKSADSWEVWGTLYWHIASKVGDADSLGKYIPNPPPGFPELEKKVVQKASKDRMVATYDKYVNKIAQLKLEMVELEKSKERKQKLIEKYEKKLKEQGQRLKYRAKAREKARLERAKEEEFLQTIQDKSGPVPDDFGV